MDQKMIGSMISYERGKKKISAQALVEGLCSVSAVQRLEAGERVPDYFVLERILERLGKSVNKIEFMYDESAYEIYYLRELIEHSLIKKDYQEVEEALLYYEKLLVSKDPLHSQHIYKIKGVIASERDGEHTVALDFFAKALEQTVPKFSFKDMDERLLGEEELVILLLWLQEKIEIEAARVVLDGDRILAYIERFCDDEETKINVYSKASWIISTLAMKKGENNKALWYALKGESILADNKVLLHLPQFLDRILLLLDKQNDDDYNEWKKQRDALKSVYEEYGYPWDENIPELWKRYRQQEAYLFSELFSQERKLMKQSQEKIAYQLDIDQKTISRIETGKYKPKKETYKKLREYLEIDRDFCTTRIVVDDFRLLELEREIAKLNTDGRETEAEQLYINLKEQLNMRWKENQQFVKYMDVIFDRELKRISYEDAIQPCIEAFQITKKEGTIDNLEKVILNRTEAFIINYISICYERTGNKEKARELLESVVKAYENSEIDLKYHYVAVSLFYSRLGDLCEELGLFDEAIEWCDKSIILELECKRGIDIGYMLSERRYTLDRKEKDNSNSKSIYKQAYQINKLMKRESRMIRLQRAYRRWYGEEID